MNGQRFGSEKPGLKGLLSQLFIKKTMYLIEDHQLQPYLLFVCIYYVSIEHNLKNQKLYGD